jgi:hypothetical protein
MSSILPALQIQPPAQQNLLEEYARIVGIKSALLQQQSQQNQIQQQQLELQDDAKWRSVMSSPDWDGTPNDLLKRGLKAGVGPQSYLAMQQHMNTLATQTAQLTKDQLANEQTLNDRDRGRLLSIIGAPEDQKQALWDGEITAEEKAGRLPPGAWTHQYPGDDVAQTFANHLALGSVLAKEAVEKQKAETEQQRAATAQQEAELRTKEFNAKLPGGQLEDVNKAELADWLKKNPGKGPSDFVAWKAKLAPLAQVQVLASGGGFGPGAAAGGAGAGGGTAAPDITNVPLAIRNQVKAVLDYRSPMPPQSRNNAVNNAVRQWVNTIDSTYDETTFPQRNKVLSEYVKSAGDGQIGAINTALGHLGELYTAAQALNQNNLPLLHSIASKVGAAFGGDAATTYTAILHRVGPEMTSAYVKGGGGEGERGANEADFALSKGQQQILSNISESAMLLNSKLASARNNWNNTFKPTKDSDQFDNRFITPDAQATLQSLSANAPTNRARTSAPPAGATMKVPGSDGKMHYSDGKRDLGVAE